MPVNLNQYRATVGAFNNCNSAQCCSYKIEYNQSFRNCDSLSLVPVIFICLVYLFTLIVYLEFSLSYLVRVKFRTTCAYLHLILYISLIFLYVNHFSIFKIFLKLSGDVENPGPKPNPILSFSIRLDEDVLKTSFVFVFRKRLQDIFKASWLRRIYSP